MYFYLEITYWEGLEIHMRMSPALLGVILSIVTIWLPELKPLLNLITSSSTAG